MKDQKTDLDPQNRGGIDRSRRDFVAFTAAAGLAAASGPASGADAKIVETDVVIKTPDGTTDAVFIYPSAGAHPGVLVWTDVFGLRPVFREFGKCLAAEGYAVLVPNAFYRSAKPPVIENLASFDFQDPVARAKLRTLADPVNAPGAAERDAVAYIDFLDAQPQVNKHKKIGTQGYCIGGPLVLRTAAVRPDRIGAGGCFHGGVGLATDSPNSPHLLAPKIQAHLYIAIAGNDDMRQPEGKDKLKEAFAAAKVPAEVEVYTDSQHGWCVPDVPLQNGRSVYNKPDAERAWTKLLALYRATLT